MTPLEELKRRPTGWLSSQEQADLVRAVDALLDIRGQNPEGSTKAEYVGVIQELASEALAPFEEKPRFAKSYLSVPEEKPMTPHPNRGEHEEEIARLEAVVKAQAEQLRIFEANCCYRYIELDDRARLTALKEQK